MTWKIKSIKQIQPVSNKKQSASQSRVKTAY